MQTGLVKGEDGRRRCGWSAGTADYVVYHDTEWGRPVVDDVRLDAKLCLEGFQAGLSWLTILRKRENFRAAFDGFDPRVVADYGTREVGRLLNDAGIVRHRGKIEAAIANAAATLRAQETHGSLAALLWSFEPRRRGRPVPVDLHGIPARTDESTGLACQSTNSRLFGRGRVADIMGDFGKGIKSFKQGLNEEDNKPAAPPAQIPSPDASPTAPSADTTKTGQ